MFKKITIMLILALLVTTAGARDYSMTYHEIQVVDELGRPVTDITDFYVFAPGGTTDAVIYMDRGRQNQIFIPMDDASANTTLVDGYCYWWGPDGYDFSLTNSEGVGPEGNTGHLPRTGSDGTIVFPSYLHAISTANYLDGESITMGTGFDWVINGGGVDDTISFVPAANHADFVIGSDSDGFGASFFLYVSDTEGWFIESNPPSASWTGGALNCNVSSNHDTNINTGNSTGAINIGSGTGTGNISIGNSAGGLITLDTAANIIINADTTIAVSNDAGDQTYTLSAGSYTIIATEDSPETFHLHVDGGATSSIFILNETGTAASAEGEIDAALQLKSIVGGIGLYSGLNDVDAIRLEATGGNAAIIMIENVDGITASAAGEFDAAIQLYSKLGGIGLYSLLDDDDSIRIEANGGTNENITIYSNLGTGSDSITLLSDAGGIAITTTAGAVAISGIGAHTITATAVADGVRGLDVGGTVAGATASEGVAAYFHGSITGNVDGKIYGTGTWLDITGSCVPTDGPDSLIAAADFGLYVAASPELANSQIRVINLEYQVHTDAAPIELSSMMHFNCDDTLDVPDYWFTTGNAAAVVYTANTAHGASATDKVGAIKVRIHPDVATGYIYIYDHPGQ